MQLLTCYSNHFKFLYNFYKYIFHFSSYSLFSHSQIHSCTLYIYFSYFTIFLFCATANLLFKSLQIFTSLLKIYFPPFCLFTFFSHSYFHSCTSLLYFSNFYYIIISCNSLSLIQITSNFYTTFINIFLPFLLLHFFLTLPPSLLHSTLFFYYYSFLFLCNSSPLIQITSKFHINFITLFSTLLLIYFFPTLMNSLLHFTLIFFFFITTIGLCNS